jgi:acetylornithine deacetylase/succinyl-diaminopimelate desuccinylase-like protein
MRSYSPFERRLRAAARAALYGSLAYMGALVLALSWWAGWQERQGRALVFTLREDRVTEEVRLLQEYVRVDTSEATGSIVEGAEFLARELTAYGLEPRIERLGERWANVWAVVEGEEPAALVLHNHIDVSDAGDLRRWRHPPFSGALDGPFLYGRGTFDMKSVAVAQLLAVRDAARRGRRPRRSLLFLATGSEERGSELGAQWVLREHTELVERFWAVLTEGGVVEPVSVEEVKYWGIETGQKRFAYGLACSPSPERLEQLAADLRQWQRFAWQPRLHPAVERFLLAYGPSRDRPSRKAVLDRLRARPFDAAYFVSQPPYLRALFLDELVTFPVEPDPGGGWRMRLRAILLPDADPAATYARLLPDWLTHGVSLTLGPPVGAEAGSPEEHEVFTTLAAATREAHPGATVGPHFLAWSVTDARFFRERGIPAYGYSPFLFFSIESLRADRENERVNVPGYVAGVELYREIVRELLD